MYQTTYHRASSLAEAADRMKGVSEGKYLAGGMTLIPTMKSRLAAPSDLIDLRHIADIKGIGVEGRKVTIGAGTTHFEVADSKEIAAVCPAFCHLAGLIGDPAVRHMGTIGGSIANNDPAADYPAAMLALNATIITDRRELRAQDFFVGLFETALEDDEIVTSISFEAPGSAGYAKFPNPASRYAIVGVFVAKSAGDVRVAITGAGDDGVFRHAAMEQALASSFNPEAIKGVMVEPDGLMSDLHATAEYRANLVNVMARRAVAMAID